MKSGCKLADWAKIEPSVGDLEFVMAHCAGECECCRYWYVENFLSDDTENLKNTINHQLGMDRVNITHNDKYTQKEVLS